MNALFPVSVWGLDPLHWTYVKLLIGQILQLKHYEGLASVSSLFTHPITKVELVGVVVGVRIRRPLISYAIDDGTGVVRCQHWFRKPTDGADSKRNADPEAPTLRLGTVVRVFGRLAHFWNQREISIHVISVEEDATAESLHWLEVMHLTETVYRRPSRILELQDKKKVQPKPEARPQPRAQHARAQGHRPAR